MVIEQRERLAGGVLPRLLGVRQTLAEDGPLLVLIAVVIALGWLAADLAGLNDRFSLFIYPETAVLLAITLSLTGLLVYALYVMIILHPRYPIRHILERLAAWLWAVGIVRLFILIAAFTLFLSVVSSLKTLIPEFVPYHWDPLLARLDAALYGGVEPWRWLQPLLGAPVVTQGINIAYNLWFFLMFALLLWQMVDVRHPQRRQRFLLAFVLVWVVNGVLLATLFSSVGPCFYGRLMPDRPDPFEPLMAYLRHANALAPVWAVPTQDHLWALYEKSGLGVGSGISAMPSMHLSMAWLMVFFFWRVHRVAGWIMLAYALVILVGSVHLAWHYSVDGYVSLLTTLPIWLLAGRWSRSWEGRTRSGSGARHERKDGMPDQARAAATR